MSSTSSKTSSLFQPLKLGPLTMRNRIVMSALTRSRSVPTNVPNGLNVEYYRQRAKGGAGLIITEGVLVAQQGTEWPHAPGLWNKEHVEGWKKVTNAVHEEGGLIYAQLWHLGRVSHPDAPEQKAAGVPVYGPSAISARGGKFRHLPGQPGYVTPTEIDDPRKLIALFKTAAINAKEAGFDGVELHGANGYLVHQFLDNTANKRTDEWGGSVENRSRFGLEVLKELIGVWGSDRVAVKLSPTGGYNDIGMTLEDTLETFRYFISEADKLNLAYIDLVRYVEMMDPVLDGKKRATKHDVVESYVSYVKNSHLFLNGGIFPEEGATLVSDGKAAAIVFGFLWIGHPDLAKRIQHGKPLHPEKTDFKTLYGIFGGSLEEQRVGAKNNPRSRAVNTNIVNSNDLHIKDLLRSGRTLSSPESTYVNQMIKEVIEGPNNQRITRRAATVTKDKLPMLESLFAPVRKLPPELLSLIFTRSVASNKFDLGHPRRSRSEASNLAAICSHWRGVALATPDIWASITFVVDVGAWEVDRWVVSLLKTHIERSQHAHLAIEILYNPEDYVSFKLDTVVISISNMLEAHFHRCTSFRLVVEPVDGDSSPWMPLCLIHVLIRALPYVQSLCVEMEDLITSDICETLRLFHLHPVPNLKALQLLVASPSCLPPKPFNNSIIPFHQLTRVHVQVTPTAAMLFISSCTNLVSAHFIIPPGVEPSYCKLALPEELQEDFDLEDDELAIALRNQIERAVVTDDEGDVFDNEIEGRVNHGVPYIRPFQSLTIEVGTLDFVWGSVPFWGLFRILGALTCPSLCSLALLSHGDDRDRLFDIDFTSDEHPDASVMGALLGFLTRSNTSEVLKSFTTRNMPFDDQEIIRLLKMMPLLKDLEIVEPSYEFNDAHYSEDHRDIFTPQLFGRMSFAASDTGGTGLTKDQQLLPNLMNLRFTALKDWEDHSFENMLASRAKHASLTPLSSVHLQLVNRIEHLDIQRIKGMMCDGSVVRVQNVDNVEEPFS
uniref:NADH:flavin oxidoreductase/NADH oxidase N-terminal domain-containing protein n=1 Tax=Moniliophthora roreri TaxID=221103 RepID=A0A0W0GEA9_MONRR